MFLNWDVIRIQNYVTADQLARIIGVKPRWVYGRISKIPHVRFAPKTIRFDLKSPQFQHWLASCEDPPKAPAHPQTSSVA